MLSDRRVKQIHVLLNMLALLNTRVGKHSYKNIKGNVN